MNNSNTRLIIKLIHLTAAPRCSLHNPNKDFQYECEEKGGKCENLCGIGGYCTKGRGGCPTWATVAAHLISAYQFINNLWNKCTSSDNH